MKNFEFTIRISFKEKDNHLYQVFSHFKKKGYKYLLDSRYSVYYKFKEFVKKHIPDDGFVFVERIDNEDDITFIYKNVGNNEVDTKDFFHTFISVIPENPGCDECLFREEINDLLFRCSFLKKELVSSKKSCQYYRQGTDIKKWK